MAEKNGNSLKFLSKTDKELRVGNYMVLFGGKDLQQEHFTKNTDFESAYTQTGMLHIDWEHGREPKTMRDPVAPNVDDVLGYVDWKTAKIDEIGLWAERVLNRRNKYMKYVEFLIENGLIGSSSMTTNEGDTKTKDGEIVKWPLYRDTLTVRPAEPRMMTDNVIAAIKSLAAINPDLEALLPQEPGDGLSAGATVGDENGAEIKEKEMSEKEKEVKETQEETEEIQVVTPEIDYGKLAEAMTPMIEKSVKAVADLPPEKPNVMVPKNTIKSIDGDIDPVEDFYNWVRTGKGKIKKHKTVGEFKRADGSTYKAALQEGTDDEGGYLVPAGELGRIIAKRDEASLLPKVGASQFTTDRDVFNIPTEGTALTKFTIVAEEGAISGAQEEMTFGQVAVTIYNFKKLIKISEELLEDYNSGLDMFLSDAIGRSWGITENYYVQVGTGSSQPQGVFVGGTAGLTLDAAAAIDEPELPELMGKLEMAYRPGAVMIMNRTTAAYLRGIQASQFVFGSAPISSITAGGEDLGIGYPVFPTEDAAAIGAGNKSLLFGNFALYGWVRNRSLRVRRLVELYAGNGQVGILANFRCGGAVLQAEALQYATHPTA